MRPLHIGSRLRRLASRGDGLTQESSLEAFLVLAVSLSCAYFFQGGGWNQNAHFATTVALVEHGTVALDRYRASTGDLAWAGEHVVSAKPIGTALVAVPGYLIARAVTAGVDNLGNRVILRAYLTSLLTSGASLTLLALLLFRLLRRRLGPGDAFLLAGATCLATPLFPNSTMLNSNALVALLAVAAYALLERPRLAGEPPSPRRLFVAGLAAAGPAAFEYMTATILLPLGIYALWQARPKRQVLFFVAGVALAAVVPLAHHWLVYGDPLHVGYSSLVVNRFARNAARGFMGFDGFSLGRLYELTLGGSRGAFFLSPFLVASVPGLVRMLRAAELRPEGLVCGGIGWGVLLLVACLTYWHSGSAVGSRYSLLFVAFAAVPIAAVLPDHRGWIRVGVAVAWGLMLLATSVTAVPPTPGRQPYENVVVWFWKRFALGQLASWQQPIIREQGIGAGDPTLPFAFNLGQLFGLHGVASLLPYLLLMVGIAVAVWRELRRPAADASKPGA